MNAPAHFTRLAELDDAWRVQPAGARLEAVRAAGRRLRERLLAGPRARHIRTYDLVTLPYPTRFGLGGAARTPVPYLMITNRMQVVTMNTTDGPKHLLVNPSDHERDEATPFFARLGARMPGFVNRLVATRHADVPTRLREAGLAGDEIDYVTWDHLHTQDVRRVMLEWCPRARLLVMRDELALFERLHPLQTDWFIADALRGIPPERIVALDGDTLVGEGVALVRTPGHTVGNHSIVFHTDRGLWAVSENGVACDNYQPEKSAIPGLARHARATGVEVLLNANTRELSLDQYTSMVLEKTLVDVVPDGSGWLQHFPSSELTASPFAPGLRPTFRHGAITQG